MPIALLCPNCKVRLTLADDRAGETLECPKCETPLTVPLPAPPAPTPRPVPIPPPLPRTPTAPGDSGPTGKRSGTRWPLWGGIAVVSLLLVAFVGWRVTRPTALSGDGSGAHTGGVDEMNQSDLATLVLDLNKIPGLTVTSIFDDKPSPMVVGILPPDRRYEYVQLGITDSPTPEKGHYLIITDCTSPDRATLVRDRWQGIGDRVPVTDRPEGGGKPVVCSSGQFVIWGQEEAIAFLRRYYRLR